MAKKIGILGGLSPELTVEYYLYLTHTYTERYGDYSYPEIIIYSVSFQPYVDWPASGRWDLIAQGLSEAAQKLEAAGADFIIISANTMHLVIDQVRSAVHIPVLEPAGRGRRCRPGSRPAHRRPARHHLDHGEGLLPGCPGAARPERADPRCRTTGTTSAT